MSGIFYSHNAKLKLFQNLRLNPDLSACASIYGVFGFNKIPLVSPGQKVISHSKQDQCSSFAHYGIECWYMKLVMQNYRCLMCNVPSTKKRS